MKTIVVPVHFSDNSANAARYAADLALSIGAEIQLLYIFQMPVSMPDAPMPQQAFESLEASGQEMLDNLSNELYRRTRGKVPIQTDLETGTVEGQIEKYCKEKEPLLVVMGATGSGLENMMTGSNSLRAVRNLHYPVLVVPENVRFHSLRNVVVACDSEDLSNGLPMSAPLLQVLENMPNIRLEVVHFLRDNESESEFSLDYNQWKGVLKGLQPTLRFIRTTSIKEGMNELLAEGTADLIVVFPKKHKVLEFHRSRAGWLIMHCGVPVMSVHE
jgi:nucleotide-binding universal stress UspA family protein